MTDEYKELSPGDPGYGNDDLYSVDIMAGNEIEDVPVAVTDPSYLRERALNYASTLPHGNVTDLLTAADAVAAYLATGAVPPAPSQPDPAPSGGDAATGS